MTLITAEEIRERGHRSVSDVLRDISGIYVWKSQEGRDLAAFRGVISADNNKILLLVDGVPWYDGVYTHAFIDDYLPISHVKQIEVSKGPGSAIYGTNAFAGVINVVTFGAEDLRGGRVRWVGGSTMRSDLQGMVGDVSELAALTVSGAAWVRVMTQEGDGSGILPDLSRDIRGADPKSALNVGARLAVGGLQLQVHHVDYTHSYLTSTADDPYSLLGKDSDQFGLYYHNSYFDLRWRLEPRRYITITPNAWFQRHRNPGSYWFPTGFTTEEDPDTGELTTSEHLNTVETLKDTRRWGGGVDIEAHPGLNHITVTGLGVENVEVLEFQDLVFSDFASRPSPAGFGADAKAALRNVYAYGQHTWTALPILEFTVGLRLDKRFPANESDERGADAFGLFLSPRAGVLLSPSDRFTAKLLYGRAFRSANVREVLVEAALQDDGTYDFAAGSFDLTPEQIHTVQAETSGQLGQILFPRASVSYSTVVSEIDKVAPPNEYQNLDAQLDIIAAELDAELKVGALSWQVGYAWTHAAYSDKVQYEFPPHMMKSRVRLAVTGQLTATLLAEIYGPRPRTAWSPDAQIDDGPAFALVHATVRGHKLGPGGKMQVAATVRNLTDTTWGSGMYRDDANSLDDGEAEYPGEIEGEGRSVHVALEMAF